MKKCSKCGENKPNDGFSKKASSKDGLQGCCKLCSSAYHKVYSAKNRDMASERGLRRESKEIRELSDRYIIKQLIQKSPLRAADVPDWLIEAKRAQLQLKRELRK